MTDQFVAVLAPVGDGPTRAVSAATLDAVRTLVLATFDDSFHDHTLTIEHQTDAGAEIVAQGPMGQVIQVWS
jgi:hypothetical protein